MALTRCSGCGAQLATTIALCPICATPGPKRRIIAGLLGFCSLVAIGAFLLHIVGRSWPVVITADGLVYRYDIDEIYRGPLGVGVFVAEPAWPGMLSIFLFDCRGQFLSQSSQIGERELTKQKTIVRMTGGTDRAAAAGLLAVAESIVAVAPASPPWEAIEGGSVAATIGTAVCQH